MYQENPCPQLRNTLTLYQGDNRLANHDTISILVSMDTVAFIIFADGVKTVGGLR